MRINLFFAVAAAAAVMSFAGAADAAGGWSALYTDGEVRAFVRGIDDDSLMMSSGGRTYLMTRTISASGARYEAAGDPATIFWERGSEALVAIRAEGIDRTLPLVSFVPEGDEVEISARGASYRMVRVASDADASYVALGEPSTSASIRGRSGELFVRGERAASFELYREADTGRADELRLTVDGLDHRLVAAHDGTRMIYVDPGDASTSFVASGDRGELRVGGEVLYAYDASPAPMPMVPTDDAATGDEWIVTELDGRPAEGISAITMIFDSDAVRGRAHVNSYHAHTIRTGRRIIVDEIASTKMMGPIELMDAEDAFFKILSDAAWIYRYGRSLAVFSSDGRSIVAVLSETDRD